MTDFPPHADRRRTPYCSPSHTLIPTLTALNDHLSGIDEACRDMNGLNYGGRIKLIRCLVANSILEVNKLCMKDIENIKQKECI